MTGPPSIPRATIRLQFNKDFTFAQATGLAPYLGELGVSHVYASPFLKARAGSMHGYDTIDHAQFNPEIGDQLSFDRFVAALHAQGIGLILDVVPNHMGVGGNDNPWWLDVLEWGRASPFAPFFDIDWRSLEPALRGKVLLPVLGDHYGAVLERAELQLKFDAERGSFSVWYWTHRFPIAIRHYARLLTEARETLTEEDGVALDPLIAGLAGLENVSSPTVQQQAIVHRTAEELRARLAVLVRESPLLAEAIGKAVASINGQAGQPASFCALHRLLEEQHYRVAYWRVAADEINYRRFFDVNDLAGLRIDRPELFELAHQLVFRLIGEGKVQGIRLDHIDGLYDPVDYCLKLQDRAAYLTLNARSSTLDSVNPLEMHLKQPFYVVVEKILAHHENLRAGWPVAGTTGYEFMALVGGLFVDASAEEAMTRTYHGFIRREVDFDRLVIETKRKVMLSSLSSELHVLATQIHRLAQESWNSRDITLTGIRRALVDVTACLPVYRTYVTAGRVDDEDRKYLDWAVARARTLSSTVDPSVYDFLHGVLTTDLAQGGEGGGHGYRPAHVVAIAMKFQQFTGPVMAKSLEDTVFYRYFRLVALNEVGGDPSRFGSSVPAFHHVNQERLKRFPFNLLATGTHDHKRGEDTRARICVLSEMAELWEQRVHRWSRMNHLKKQEFAGAVAPGRSDEYLLYQTLVGAWPLELEPLELEGQPGEPLTLFCERIVACMIKAVREAKVHSSWVLPNADYEEALRRFVQGVLDPERSAAFLGELMDLVETVAPVGAVNGLSQLLLKLTAPGVPDIYQGADFWDLSLVDPDNRRPVDYAARHRALMGLQTAPDLDGLLDSWRDGRIKQFVIHRTLGLRKREAPLFAIGAYQPVEVVGEHAERVVAFLRRANGGSVVVVAPRLVAPLMREAKRPLPPAESWGDTALALPEMGEGMVDIFTGRVFNPPAAGCLPVSALLDRFPLALLHRGAAS